MNKIDIRSSLHSVIGYLRRNEIICAYELVCAMSAQMDKAFYRSEGKATGGYARAAKLSAHERHTIGRKAAAVRWGNKSTDRETN